MRMNLGWIIELILPGLIHSNEKVRDMVRFSLFYCVEPFAFTLPVNVAAMVESMKKIPFIAQNKEIIRIEVLKFYYIIAIKHSHSHIVYPSFIDKSMSLLLDTLNYLKQCEVGNVADQHEKNIRFHFFQLCSKIFRKNTESNYLNDGQYIELIEYILSYTGYGPLYNDKSPFDNDTNHSKSTQSASYAQQIIFWANKALSKVVLAKELDHDELLEESGEILLYALELFELCENSTIRKLGRKTLLHIADRHKNLQEKLIKIFVKYAYHSNPYIHRPYFKIVAELIQKPEDMFYPLDIVLPLSFYHLLNLNLNTRKKSVQLIHYLSTRYFRTKANTFLFFTISQSSENIHSNYFTSFIREFAKLHPELALPMLNEILFRIPYLTTVNQKNMMLVLVAWCSELKLRDVPDNSTDSIIKFLIATTWNIQHSGCAHTVQPLWKSFTVDPYNLIILLKSFSQIVLEYQNEQLMKLLLGLCVYFSENHEKMIYKILIEKFMEKVEFPNNNTGSSSSVVQNSIQMGNAKNKKEIPRSNEWKQNFDEIFEKSNDKIYTKTNFSMILLSEIILYGNQTNLLEFYLPKILSISLLLLKHENKFFSETGLLFIKNVNFKLIQKHQRLTKELEMSYSAINTIFLTFKRKNKSKIKRKKNKENIKKIIKNTINIVKATDKEICDKVIKEILEIALNGYENQEIILQSLKYFQYILFENKLKIKENEFNALLKILIIQIKNKEARKQLKIQKKIGEIFEFILREKMGENQKLNLRNEDKYIIKIFWIGVGLLFSDILHEYSLGIQLLIQYFKFIKDCAGEKHIEVLNEVFRLISWNVSVPNHSLSVQFPGLNLLLLKGFSIDLMELNLKKLLNYLILYSKYSFIDEDPQRKLLIFILFALPDLITLLESEHSLEISSNISTLCCQRNLLDLGELFGKYAELRNTIEGIHEFLIDVTDNLAAIFFPKYENLTFSILIGILENGGQRFYTKTILQLIECFLSKLNPAESKLLNSEFHKLAPILNYLKDGAWPFAMEIVNVILCKYSPLSSPLKQAHQPSPFPTESTRLALIDYQSSFSDWQNIDQSRLIVCASLTNILKLNIPDVDQLSSTIINEKSENMKAARSPTIQKSPRQLNSSATETNFIMLRRREITPEVTFSHRAATVVSVPASVELEINAKRPTPRKEISPKLVLEEPKSRNKE